MLTLNDFFIRGFVRNLLSSDSAPQGLLLDLGCGRQPIAQLLQKRKWRSVSVDIDSKSTANIIADAKYLPFDQNCFEGILCLEAIEHIYDYDAAISEMARVLKPGGILVIAWPFMYGMHDVPADYNRFSEFAMEQNLKQHGLAIIQLIRRGDSLGVLHTIIGQYACWAMEALTRIAWIGVVLRPLKYVVHKFMIMTYWLHYVFVNRSRRLNPASTGDGLRGMPGVLALWTLGYCAIARKDGNICRP